MTRTEDYWTARCCRDWPVLPYYGNMGRCGLCGERPEIIYTYWEEEDK